MIVTEKKMQLCDLAHIFYVKEIIVLKRGELYHWTHKLTDILQHD